MATRSTQTAEIIPSSQCFLGNQLTAQYHIQLFGDYQSVETAKAHELVKKLLLQYPEQICYTFHHFPLTQVHPYAHKAAEAAVAAAQEGKFWEMHELLLQKRSLGTISLKGYAKEIGVTDKNFLNKLIDSFYGWTVRADLLDGLGKGVRSVPGFLVNGEQWVKENEWSKLPKIFKAKLSELN